MTLQNWFNYFPWRHHSVNSDRQLGSYTPAYERVRVSTVVVVVGDVQSVVAASAADRQHSMTTATPASAAEAHPASLMMTIMTMVCWRFALFCFPLRLVQIRLQSDADLMSEVDNSPWIRDLVVMTSAAWSCEDLWKGCEVEQRLWADFYQMRSKMR